MSDKEIVRLACIYAVQDREAFIAAYSRMPDDPACIEAEKYLKELKAYVAKQNRKTGIRPADFGACEEMTLDQIREAVKQGTMPVVVSPQEVPT